VSAKRARKIAAKHGLAVASEGASEQLISAKFDGDPFQITNAIANYDAENDELVINSTHPAWADMKTYIQSPKRKGFFSTRSPDHIVRHEIGHALHYRGMTEAERAEIWYQELTPEEQSAAARVSKYAKFGRIEFVAEVYAGLWGRRTFGPEVMAIYEKLKGPPR
jgi:hypothetical protein